MRLTWDDLLIQDISPEELAGLNEWSRVFTGRYQFVCMSKFGVWFLRRPDGSTDELCPIGGTVTRMASTPEEFASCMNRQDWQERHLQSFFVLKLHERGLIPKKGECYGFAPHPVFSGRIDLNQALVTNLRIWQSMCAQLFPA